MNNSPKTDYDAIVVGSGPNGLAAAITLQRAGLSVLLLESKSKIGGGIRTEELTLPGFKHDVCSAIHPMAMVSPFFQNLDLKSHGLEFIFPPVAAAHPFEDGRAAILKGSIEETAKGLGRDEKVYLKIFGSLLKEWPQIVDGILGPIHFPEHPLAMASFGIDALQPASWFAKNFQTEAAKALWAGMAAHAIQPLSNVATSAIALVLMTAGHLHGWPLPRGGSASIANALGNYFVSLGGKIETNFHVQSLDQLPSSKAILFDITPRQILKIAGHKFSSLYKWQLERYRYGMGVFKIDWALAEPIPFKSEECRKAGTVHLGNSFQEIVAGEKSVARGQLAERPFVLLAQQSLFDESRAPIGKHTGWAYCHVPHGSAIDMTSIIENQVERFAPGIRDRILARHTMDTKQLESYNENYVGGDINGGVIDIGQLFTRPALRASPYRTSAKGLYLCSSSTPPGGGVHGMCGYHAARRALKDIFEISV